MAAGRQPFVLLFTLTLKEQILSLINLNFMASGIPQDYDEEMIHNCIKLFLDENVGGEE